MVEAFPALSEKPGSTLTYRGLNFGEKPVVISIVRWNTLM